MSCHEAAFSLRRFRKPLCHKLTSCRHSGCFADGGVDSAKELLGCALDFRYSPRDAVSAQPRSEIGFAIPPNSPRTFLGGANGYAIAQKRTEQIARARAAGCRCSEEAAMNQDLPVEPASFSVVVVRRRWAVDSDELFPPAMVQA